MRRRSDSIESDHGPGHVKVKIVTAKSLDDRPLHFSGVASRLRRLDASILLWLALIAVLAFLVLNPVLRLIISSLQETDTGKFTFANYRVAYGNVRQLQALVTSLELGVAVALLSTPFAFPITSPFPLP